MLRKHARFPSSLPLLFGLALLILCSACQRRSYDRPPGVLSLGEVRKLLFEKQHVADKAVLLYRDEEGWAALSTRSTYSGCDLTYQEKNLLDSCSGSEFTHDGRVLKGPATRDLPWLEMFYQDNRLFVRTGRRVESSTRFTTTEIEQAIDELRKKVQAEDGKLRMEIPKILLGDGDQRGNEIDRFADELEDLSNSEVQRLTDEAVKPF